MTTILGHIITVRWIKMTTRSKKLTAILERKIRIPTSNI